LRARLRNRRLDPHSELCNGARESGDRSSIASKI